MNLQWTAHRVSFDLETSNDEIAVDVPLPGEPAEMSGDHNQGRITEEAFFKVSPGARQVRQRKQVKMSQLTPAERRESLKSMDPEWQTLLKNQAAKVLSLEETRALARSCDRYSLGSYLEARRQHAIWTSGQGTTHHQGFHRS